MKLSELRLNGFGMFSDLTLTLPSRFGLIVGANEAGKTTIADAIIGVLFGFRRGQKHLRENYRPWRGDSYRASLVLTTDTGSRYLVGRDFHHNRVEAFRGEGVRLEPLANGEWEQILRETLGLHSAQAFEYTSLIRQTESSFQGRMNAAAAAIKADSPAELPDEDRSRAAKALTIVRARQDKTDREKIERMEARLDELHREIDWAHEQMRRYDELAAEKASVETELAALRKESEEDIRGEIGSGTIAADVVTRYADSSDGGDSGLKPPEVKKDEPEGPEIYNSASLSKVDELEDRLLTLEVEYRYEEEVYRQNRAEAEILTKEIAATRAKLQSIDEEIISEETRNRVSGLLPIITDHTGRLEFLRSELERSRKKLANLKRWRWLGLGLGLLVASSAALSWIYLPISRAWALTGLTGYLLACTTILAGRSLRLQGKAHRLEEELKRREAELEQVKSEFGTLLKGRTYSQYLDELSANRLYRNDLWEFEQALERKEAVHDPDHRTTISQAMDETRSELSQLLQSMGYTSIEEFRDKLGPSAQNPPPTPAAAGREPEKAESPPPRTERPELTAKARVLQDRLTELQTELLDCRRALGDRDLEALEEDQAQLATGLARARRDEQVASITCRCLEELLAGVENGLPPGLPEEIGRMLGEMTGGRYRQVRLEKNQDNLTVKIKAEDSETWPDPAFLSAGTIDQLYLALRAAIMHLTARGERFPLLLDDPFTSLDRSRLAETVAVLAQLSEEHQVIWLTKDQDLAGLISEKTGLKPEVIELRS